MVSVERELTFFGVSAKLYCDCLHVICIDVAALITIKQLKQNAIGLQIILAWHLLILTVHWTFQP